MLTPNFDANANANANACLITLICYFFKCTEYDCCYLKLHAYCSGGRETNTHKHLSLFNTFITSWCFDSNTHPPRMATAHGMTYPTYYIYISYFRGTSILVVVELKYYSRPVRAGPHGSGGLFPEPDPPASPRTYLGLLHIYYN